MCELLQWLHFVSSTGNQRHWFYTWDEENGEYTLHRVSLWFWRGNPETTTWRTLNYIFHKGRLNTYSIKAYLDFGAKCGYFPYHRITFSNNTDFVCFQFNWLLLMGTLLQETSDFHSTTKREQPFFFENNKKMSVMLGLALHLNRHGGGLWLEMNRNAYGSFRSELAIICNDCKELPSFTWRKRFFFWGRTERTHPYNKIKYRKKKYLNYPATFSAPPKNT